MTAGSSWRLLGYHKDRNMVSLHTSEKRNNVLVHNSKSNAGWHSTAVSSLRLPGPPGIQTGTKIAAHE